MLDVKTKGDPDLEDGLAVPLLLSPLGALPVHDQIDFLVMKVRKRSESFRVIGIPISTL